MFTPDFLEFSWWLDVCLNAVRTHHSFDFLCRAFHVGDADCCSFGGPSWTGVEMRPVLMAWVLMPC